MPVGSFSLIYRLAEHLQKHRPKSVLDLGVGFGLAGAIVRQYLDDGVKPFKTELNGVEAFGGYKNTCWGLYDKVFEEDIRAFVDRWLKAPSDPQNKNVGFDFIIFSDVLEHFEKEEGLKLIYDLIGLLNKGGVLWIATPGVWCEQDAVHGNEYERHRSLWKWNEFPSGFEVIKNGQGDEHGHYMILVKYVKK